MCRRGDAVLVDLAWVPSGAGYAERYQLDALDIDRCIADEVLWLNGQGVRTSSSCCGHVLRFGSRLGYIAVADEESAALMRKIGYRNRNSDWDAPGMFKPRFDG